MIVVEARGAPEDTKTALENTAYFYIIATSSGSMSALRP